MVGDGKLAGEALGLLKLADSMFSSADLSPTLMTALPRHSSDSGEPFANAPREESAKSQPPCELRHRGKSLRFADKADSSQSGSSVESQLSTFSMRLARSASPAEVQFSQWQ